MNFDGESILIEEIGAATSSPPMCVRAVNSAHNTSIEGDTSHSSIAGSGTVEDVPHDDDEPPSSSAFSTSLDLLRTFCIMPDYI